MLGLKLIHISKRGPGWPLLGLLSWCHIAKPNHCNSFGDGVSCRFHLRIPDLQKNCSEGKGMLAQQRPLGDMPYWIFLWLMMTSSNGNIFRVAGPLCGEFTGHRWIPHTRTSDADFDVFFDLRLNQQLSKQWRHQWFETPSHSLWRPCNALDFPAVYPYVFLCFQVSGSCTVILNTTSWTAWLWSFSRVKPGRCHRLREEWRAVGTSPLVRTSSRMLRNFLLPIIGTPTVEGATLMLRMDVSITVPQIH